MPARRQPGDRTLDAVVAGLARTISLEHAAGRGRLMQRRHRALVRTHDDIPHPSTVQRVAQRHTTTVAEMATVDDATIERAAKIFEVVNAQPRS